MSEKCYSCSICNKNYKSYQSIWNHNNRYHTNQTIQINPIDNKIRKFSCTICDKKFTTKHCMQVHTTLNCKKKIDDYNIMKKKIKELENEINVCKIEKDIIVKNKELENTILQLVKKIEILENNSNMVSVSDSQLIIEDKVNDIINSETLTLNDIVIISRIKDNYINATQLCQAGNMNFNDWFSLDSTKELINGLASDIENPTLQLIDIQQSFWIHPDLAIQLAQWISPKFALQVIKWIRTLFNNGKIEVKENELKLKDQKIQLLQDQFQKKQQRKNYPEKNVIYIVTSEDNKNKRIYIVGKANILKNRLSTYNKTAEHEVVFYKACKNEENMKLVELMVLAKMEKYREKANRDRFILPLQNDISLFTNIIDESINFF